MKPRRISMCSAASIDRRASVSPDTVEISSADLDGLYAHIEPIVSAWSQRVRWGADIRELVASTYMQGVLDGHYILHTEQPGDDKA